MLLSMSLSPSGFNVDAEEDLPLVEGIQLKPYKMILYTEIKPMLTAFCSRTIRGPPHAACNTHRAPHYLSAEPMGGAKRPLFFLKFSLKITVSDPCLCHPPPPSHPHIL